MRLLTTIRREPKFHHPSTGDLHAHSSHKSNSSSNYSRKNTIKKVATSMVMNNKTMVKHITKRMVMVSASRDKKATTTRRKLGRMRRTARKSMDRRMQASIDKID